MLHPSYTEVLERINEDDYRGDLPRVESRYSIVTATAKRAREIIGGSDPLVTRSRAEKPLSIAVKELYEGKIKIVQNDDEPVDNIEAEDIMQLNTEEDQPEEA